MIMMTMEVMMEVVMMVMMKVMMMVMIAIIMFLSGRNGGRIFFSRVNFVC